MFSRQVENEVKTLFADSNDVFGKTFTYDQLGHLPEPVLRYFKYSLQEGRTSMLATSSQGMAGHLDKMKDKHG